MDSIYIGNELAKDGDALVIKRHDQIAPELKHGIVEKLYGKTVLLDYIDFEGCIHARVTINDSMRYFLVNKNVVDAVIPLPHVGDIVRIRSWESMAEEFGVNSLAAGGVGQHRHYGAIQTPGTKFLGSMEWMCGARGVIRSNIREDNTYPVYFAIGETYTMTPYMFDMYDPDFGFGYGRKSQFEDLNVDPDEDLVKFLGSVATY